MLRDFFGHIKVFFGRQTENFRVLFTITVIRGAVSSLTMGRSGASYIQLYIRALGANTQQLGFLNSLGRIVNALFALPVGWISDRVSLKKVIMLGLVLAVFIPGTYVLSTAWVHTMPAIILSRISFLFLGVFSTIFFITSVKGTADRATAMSMRSTVTNLVGLAIPLLAAVLVTNFGGINVQGIRPLFVIQAVAHVFVLIYAAVRLKEVSFLRSKEETGKRRMLHDYREIASQSAVKKWSFCKCLRMFFANALMPFTPLFLVEIKHATPLILGLMGTVSTLTALIFTVPIGRLADKHGRKKIIYITRPLSYASTLATILAPSPEYLVVSSFLGAFAMIGQLMEITMEHELVPAEQRGRWGGFLFFLMGITSIPGPLLLGFLWEVINPAYLLLLPIFADLPFLVVLPTIQDTLHPDYNNIETPSHVETRTETTGTDPSPHSE